MSKKKDLLKNTIIIGFGKMSTQLASFLLLPLYTFFLTPDEYGAVDLIITYVALLVPAVTVQLEMASFRFLVDARKDEAAKKQIISNVLQVIALILVTCIALFWLVNLFVDIPYGHLVLLIICVTIFANLFLQFARGVGDNMKFAIACMVTGVTNLISAIVFIMLLGMGAEGMLLAVALANFVCSVYLFFALKIYKYIGRKTQDKNLQKELVKYSFPLVPNGISWWVINVSDRTIIAIIIGVAANGIYAVANKYAAIFASLFAVFSLSWTESASVHIDSKERNAFFSEISNASIRLFGSLGLVLIALAPIVFTLFINEQFSEAYLYVPVLIAAAFFNALVGLYSAIYIAKKMTKQVANTSMVAAGVSIVLNLVLIHFIGLWAAAISTAVAYLAMAIYRHYDVKKYVTITYQKSLFVILSLAYLVTTGFYYMNDTWGNVVNIVLVLVFAVFMNKSIVSVVWNKIFQSRN